jgi:hypothetical protein
MHECCEVPGLSQQLVSESGGMSSSSKDGGSGDAP